MSTETRTVTTLLAAVLAALGGSSALAQADFSEGFDNVGPTNGDGPQILVNQGWIFRNQSSPRGTQSWFDGYTDYYWPAPQSGTGYLAVTSGSTDDFGGTVSNWAILPTIANQQAGDRLQFYLYDMGGSNTTTLQVRYSPSGGTSTGSGAGAVGDFTQLLLDINPIPPGGWNLYAVTLPGTGRVALRYYIADACNFACFASYTGIDSLSVGEPPAPPCNLPLVPVAGQSVTWTAADSPYRVCQNIAIPPGATVVVEPGVQVDFDEGMQLQVSGTLQLSGQKAQRIDWNAPAVYPPMIEVTNGTVEASFTDFGGQVRVNTGATIELADCVFAGNGLLWAQEIQAVAPFIHLVGCTFDQSVMSLSDALVILEDNTFIDMTPSILRGYADVTAVNTVIGGMLEIIREESVQPFVVDGVNASGSSSAGLSLSGGEYLLGSTNALQSNLYPLHLLGGLTRDSVVPTTGNTINAIDVGNGGFAGSGIWPQIGLPYRLTEPATSLPGGNLTIDPGVIVEGAHSLAALYFRSTRHGVLRGQPDSPITFRGLDGQSWGGLSFYTNATTGTRLEHCVVEDAQFGAISSDNWLYVDSCLFHNNQVGANTNTYGVASFAKTRFIGNGAGVSFTDLGSPILNNPAAPNSFEDNAAGIDAFEPLFDFQDMANCWWGDPSGPTIASNAGGTGDSIVGPGAPAIIYQPFLSAVPNAGNHPPVTHLVEPGLTRLYAAPDYTHSDFLLESGTAYILHWSIESDDAIVAQRIDFSPDGPYPDRYLPLAENIPAGARAWELTIPDPGYAVTHGNQFLRLTVTDAAGQTGFAHVPVQVPSGRITGDVTITTDLSGQTFIGGSSIPDMHWTGSATSFPTYVPLVVLESDGAAVMGIASGGQGYFFQDFPRVSTDRARLALLARGNSNDVLWTFADGYFSIRHDPRFGFEPPSVQLLSPLGGESFSGGSTIPIGWSAGAAEGLRSFDIQTSYDGGRTWHPIVRDLVADATSFDWGLPASTGIPDVRIRVIVRDQRFQNSSATSGPFEVTPGVEVPGDLDGDGDVDVADYPPLADCLAGPDVTTLPGECLPGQSELADLNDDGDVDLGDLSAFQASFTGPQ